MTQYKNTTAFRCAFHAVKPQNADHNFITSLFFIELEVQLAIAFSNRKIL